MQAVSGKSGRIALSAILLGTFLLVLLSAVFAPAEAARTQEEFSPRRTTATGHEEARRHIAENLPLSSCIPFVGILLSIAVLPMLAPVFWHHHFPKVSFGWGLLFVVPFVAIYEGEGLHEVLHIIFTDYIPFIILLWGLFTVSGGIYLKGTLVGSPRVNTLILLVGTLLASWMGTTGAAMLLIRPLIRANRGRQHKVHTIIFFIFLVANIGGCLTPLGDPPLFLGFLHGVPFFWTMTLWKQLLFVAGILLALYYVIDSTLYAREQRAKELISETELPRPYEPPRVLGSHNIVFLLGIIGAVLISGSWHPGEFHALGLDFAYESLLREIIIITMGVLSLKLTKREYRRANGFTWSPIKEVAYLFGGIFMTIVAPLLILQAGEDGAARLLIKMVNSPAEYFWITGILSSFLDNAPTYLTFFNLSLAKLQLTEPQVTQILRGLLQSPVTSELVAKFTAIALGAVFFGATTYIGNAPNFMVRAIAEESRIRMPSFFGYLLWSLLILWPIFALLTVIFIV